MAAQYLPLLAGSHYPYGPQPFGPHQIEKEPEAPPTGPLATPLELLLPQKYADKPRHHQIFIGICNPGHETFKPQK